MNSIDLHAKFTEIHGNDQDQLDFILSNKKKIIVTAPAGCGKTKAMVSKIAHEIITYECLNQKKILALTFSVNAAAKIRDDINETLPILLDRNNYKVDKKLDIFNYHGFANKILKKHGYIINMNLKNINTFFRTNDYSLDLEKYLDSSEVATLKKYDQSLKSFDFHQADYLRKSYINIVLNKLVPQSIITYNGIILLAIEILDIKTVNDFYKLYYPMVIVDEFQDTNYLALQFLKRVMNSQKVILMGDNVQKIYGFLGALPNIFTQIESEYNMCPMEFKTNYRFKDNKNMKQLDSYIRGLFKNYTNINSYTETADIKFKLFKTDHGEANYIYKEILKHSKTSNSVSILFRAKYLASKLINILEKNELSYFNGLFDDNDSGYLQFHKIALETFIKESGERKSISNKVKSNVRGQLITLRHSLGIDETIFNSLIKLLDTLFESVKAKNVSKEEKYEMIFFVLSNNSLKRLMSELKEQIVLTTIHSSKGLEWDYVYLPNMTAFSFPSSNALCKLCNLKNGRQEHEKHCEFKFIPELEDPFYEELSVLYVGLTRAKRDVFLTANIGTNQNGYSKKVSCFITLPNLNRIRDHS